MFFDFSVVFASLSKSYRDLTNKAHDQMIEAWIKAEQAVEDNIKLVSFWKK